MGVQTRVVIYDADAERARHAAGAAFCEISRLERILSDYDPNSEISQLVEMTPGKAHAVSADLAAVITAARSLGNQTGGAFDITIGPLVRLWRQARRDQILPPSDALDEARRRVGWDLIDLDDGAVTMHAPGMQLDFGGIGKGYAAQHAMEVLEEAGLPRSLVAIAGDIVVGAPPPGAAGWRVMIETGNAGGTPRTLTLSHCAVSTSGDTEQFVEVDGTRYSHIVDPRTGLGLTNRTAATVIAPEGTLADGLASSICIIGIDAAGDLLAAHPQCAAIVEQVREEDLVVQIVDPIGILDDEDNPKELNP